jgi:REP element-mobilizing transposase RayT
MKNRKSPRCNNWDYSTPGYYFVTICTKNREYIFGHIVGTGLRPVPTWWEPVPTPESKRERVNENKLENPFYPMILNDYGKIVLQCWNDLPNYYKNCEIDEFVIMPNHVHCIVNLNRYEKNGLSEIVGSLKSFSSRRINELRGVIGTTIWQSRFHDHIIRNDIELYHIRNYIQNNPANWIQDELANAA